MLVNKQVIIKYFCIFMVVIFFASIICGSIGYIFYYNKNLNHSNLQLKIELEISKIKEKIYKNSNKDIDLIKLSQYYSELAKLYKNNNNKKIEIYNKSIEFYNDLLKKRPELDSIIYYCIANSYIGLEDFDKVENIYKKLINKDKNNLSTYLYYG